MEGIISMRNATPFITIDTILHVIKSNNVIINTIDKNNEPITYKHDKYNKIPDDIKKQYITKFSAYYKTICGELYTVLDVDICLTKEIH